MGYGYRLFSRDHLIPATSSNPDGTQLALAEMDPDPLNVAGGHRNVWVEASLDARREWVEFYGPAHEIDRMDSWNVRSNDPNRINSFPAPPVPVSTAPTATASSWARVVGLIVVAVVLLVIAAFAPHLFPDAAYPVAIVLVALGAAAGVLGGFSVPGLIRARASGSVSVDPAPQHRGDA